jgi:hypothetical protein
MKGVSFGVSRASIIKAINDDEGVDSGESGEILLEVLLEILLKGLIIFGVG